MGGTDTFKESDGSSSQENRRQVRVTALSGLRRGTAFIYMVLFAFFIIRINKE